MFITVQIEFSKVVEEVNMQSYYLGEAFKRKDADYAGVQTSVDDADMLVTPIETAVNDISAHFLKRVKSYDWDIADRVASFYIEPYYRVPEDDAEKCGKLLAKAMLDYMVTCCMIHWLSIVNPELVAAVQQRSLPQEATIIRVIGMIAHHTRRRPTDLGGV